MLDRYKFDGFNDSVSDLVVDLNDAPESIKKVEKVEEKKDKESKEDKTEEVK